MQRRDFLNGVALAVPAAVALPSGDPRPRRFRRRRLSPRPHRHARQPRRLVGGCPRAPRRGPVPGRRGSDTGERYDLVVVGGGLSRPGRGLVLPGEGGGRRAGPRPRQPRRLRRPRQAQRVPHRRPDHARQRRRARGRVGLALRGGGGEAPARPRGGSRARQEGLDRGERRPRGAGPGRRRLLRQGDLRRGPPGGRARAAAPGREFLAAHSPRGGRAPRHRPPLRREGQSRLHAGALVGGEEGAPRANELRGVPHATWHACIPTW